MPARALTAGFLLALLLLGGGLPGGGSSGGAALAQVPQTPIHPSKTGAELVSALQSDYTPTRTLGYDIARDSLFRYLDTRDGVLIGRYGGYSVDIGPEEDPTTAAYESGAGLSTEHTWPQSKGAGSEPAKSDMHALFPVKQTINAARSNHPYAEIPDTDTDTWYRLSSSQSSVPSSNTDEYSELDGSDGTEGPRFEVPEDHEGNAARAALYFYAVYQEQASESFFDVQKNTLLQWHASDPIDQNEYDLGQWIKTKQGTANPFVLDTTLVRRAFGAPSRMPTVQFATSDQSAGEAEGTATLTVELTQPDGAAVDVDVVFDEAASSATAGDLGAFSTQTISFPSSASEGSTRDVTVPLTDDSELEGIEEAVFALQNVQTTGAAQVGPRRSTALTIVDDENPLVINEVLADPAPGTAGDANQDGTRSATDDEFIEIYNTSESAAFDLSGYAYVDVGVGTRHTFPSGSVVGHQESIVVFGGGTPSSQIPGVVQTASNGTLGLKNAGDSLTITNGGDTVLLDFSYAGNITDQSMTRDPDFTGPFVGHISASGSGGALFSPGRTVEAAPLPVELVTFEARLKGEGTVQLVWRTASESNNAGFEVQRRTGPAHRWKALRFIKGAGTTGKGQRYQYADDDLPLTAPRLRYRLRQVDSDGTSHFSKPVTVDRRAVANLQLRVPFPNPTSGPVTIQYAVPTGSDGEASLEVYDLLGRRVHETGNLSPGNGLQTLSLNLSGLSSGTYFLRLTSGPQQRIRSLTIAR